MMNYRPDVVSLNATITKLKQLINTSSASITFQQVRISPKQTFINNSTTSQEQNFENFSTLTNSIVFEFPVELSHISSIIFNNSVEIELQTLMSFEISDGVLVNKSKYMPVVHQPNLNDPFYFQFQSSKLLQIQKSMIISPCINYVVSLLAEMIKSFEIPVRLQLKVSEQSGPERMQEKFVRESLSNLIYENMTITKKRINCRRNCKHGSKLCY